MLSPLLNTAENPAGAERSAGGEGANAAAKAGTGAGGGGCGRGGYQGLQSLPGFLAANEAQELI